MRHAALAVLLLVLIPGQVAALDTTELLGLVAMPLAIAAAADITGVPAGELTHLVATLNQANVPPTQVIQVVRYAPVALVVEERPTFVQFVDTEVQRGVVGPQLVTSIDRRLRTYDIEPQFVALRQPATTFVIADDYIPPVVVTRVTELRPAGYRPLISGTDDLLALIAMPLAVSAVSEIAGVPLRDLTHLVATLNGANVAPVQVVEVLRYSPVALIADDYGFVQFVDLQVANGLTGPRLVDVIEDRFRVYDVEPRIALAPSSSITVVDETFFPPVVRTRVAQVRGSHPHGGPPGQLKKDLGLQTGAEVVHGQHPGRGGRDARRVTGRSDRPGRVAVSERRAERPRAADRQRQVVVPSSELGRGGPKNVEPPGQRKKNEGAGRGGSDRGPQGGTPPGQAQGQGQGQGKGKGKGKG